MMNDEQYDMGAYLESAEEIARKKLEMYSELLSNINSFKQEFMQPQQLAQQADQVQAPKEFIRLPNAKKR